jgi:hypothetical protein
LLTGVLDRPSRWPASTANMFKAARLLTARSLAEFLTDVVRVRVVADEWSRDQIGAPGLDADAADIMNERLPLTMLASAAETTSLPEAVRRQIAIAAFTRAVLLDDESVVATLAQTLGGLAPELKQPLVALMSARPPAARRSEARLMLLRYPGLQPFVRRHGPYPTGLHRLDPLRDHWWCAFSPPGAITATPVIPGQPARYTASYETGFTRQWRDPRFLQPLYPTSDAPQSPAFLSDAERARAGRELAALARQGAAATALARQAVAFARANATDARAAETLYLGVRATRYGCADDDTGKASKAAFDLLHRAYPKTEWAKRTPYWYR